MSRRPRVLVAGAGIGGLTLGIALGRAGLEVDLYEQAPELAEVGAAVGLSANGTRQMYRLGVGERLDHVSTQPTELIYRDGRTGERIAAHAGGSEYRERFGAPYWGIHRVDLQRGLLATFTEVVGDEHLHLGHAVTEVDPGESTMAPSLTLDDGTVVSGDVVVGADGVHSMVRDRVVDAEPSPTYTGTSGFRGLVPVADLPSLPDPYAIQFWAGPHAHLLHYALGGSEHGDDTVNFLAVLCGPESWSGGNRETEPGELLAGFDGWHPAVREMLAAVPQSPRWPLLAQAPLRRWTRGRLALIGDACHAMLPHHGQGANQSIEDAIVLAKLLVDVDLLMGTDLLDEGGDGDGVDAALARYPRLRRARTRAIAASAWETGALLHLPDGHDRIGERDKRFSSYLPDNDWVHSYDAHRA